MHIARKKIKTHIGEYFLYMFQIEDLLRACQFNPKLVDEQIVAKYNLEPIAKNELKQWYLGLADLMQEEKIEQKGHLRSLQNKIDEVNEFHLYCLTQPDDEIYLSCFNEVKPILDELRTKQISESENQVLRALNAIYGLVLLKMKKQPVSDATQEAIVKLVAWINILSSKFREYEAGDIQLDL